MVRLGRRGLVLALVLGGVWVAACGGSSGDAVTGALPDGGAIDGSSDATKVGSSSGQPDSSTGGDDDDGSTPDTGAPDTGAPDTGVPDACTPGACSTAAGGAGILDTSCNCNACDANGATTTAADTACQTTYPGSLCISSSCVPGDCRSTTGTTPCSGGEICGATNANECGPCTKTSDCTDPAAYGTGFVCSTSGSCVMGGCATSADCDTGATAGDVCIQNQCGSCTSDSQCANDAYYSGSNKTICDTTLNTCVSATCSTNRAACDGTHLCCTTACLPDTTFTATGNNRSCCSAADCAGVQGFTACVNNECSACPAVTDGNYYVDPVNGTDNGSSGTNGDGCRFKTLAHAFTVANAAAGTKNVYLINDDSTEKAFPLNVPANVTLVGYDGTALKHTTRTILVQAGANGLSLAHSNSGVSFISIDGVNGDTTMAAKRYNTGITIAGNPNATVLTNIALDHVSVTNSLSTGILIGGTVGVLNQGATVTFGAGMSVTGAGFTTGTLANGNAGASPATGVIVSGSAQLTITGGPDQSTFSNNTQHGIWVENSAGLTITATPIVGSGDYHLSPVVAFGNTIAGLFISQTADGASTSSAAWAAMPTCNINGLVTANAVSGNGIRLEGGSKVRIRNSVSYGNAGDGVHIESGGTKTTIPADANFIGAMDLGTNASAGANVFQVPYGNVGATYNKGAGVCLAIAATATNGPVLSALGNKLVGTNNAAADCSTATATVVKNNLCRSGAGAPASIGVTPAQNNSNSINISQCD